MASSEQVSAFISRHRTLIEAERRAEAEQNSLLLSNCASHVLERRGLALTSLGVVGVSVGLGGRSLIELSRPSAYHTSPTFPPHTFRPGDIGRIEPHVNSNGSRTKGKPKKTNISAGEKAAHQAVEGVVYSVTDTRIVIAVDPSEPNSDDSELPQHCRLLKLANSVTFDRMDKTLNQLECMIIPEKGSGAKQASLHVTRLSQVLLGIVPPSPRQPVAELKFFDESLNASQQEAVRFALECPEVACIHGPPGTGKTHTLIEIIRQILSPQSADSPNEPSINKRVLVCGASNLSVDNILERLLLLPSASQGPLRCTRLGHPARVTGTDKALYATLDAQASRSDQAELARDVKTELETALGQLTGKSRGQKGKGLRGEERRRMWGEVRELRKEYRRRERAVVSTVLGQAQIVLATCHTAGSRQLKEMEFDVVIIDEATQALEAACWIPILKGKKLILAGDPMQLPPTVVSSKHSEKDKKKSLTTTRKDGPVLSKVVSKPESDITSAGNATNPAEAVTDKDEDHSSGLMSLSSSEDELPAVQPPNSNERPPCKDSGRKKTQGSILRPPRSLEVTLFERLEKVYGSKVKRMLKIQYRMHSDICAFPTEALYQSKLQTDRSVASHLLRDLANVKKLSPEEEKEVLGTPVVFFDTQGCEYFERVDGDNDEGSKCNENEAMVVKMWVERLAEAGLLASQIAVITPYQAQVTLLSSLLHSTYGSELEIGTVDGMQGREKEAVIISLVRSNEKREVGFLKEKRRLNVAMTRARRHLCVVGDSSTVQHGSSYLKKWIDWLENHADVRYGGLE